jgi:peptidyl-prolyl cis-trans isomerase B (cyclophilin B)
MSGEITPAKGSTTVSSNVKAQVAEAQKNIDLAKNTYSAALATNKGPIRLSFLPEVAPGHVKNFLALAQIGFYNGVTFHRVIKGFMIQGGCPQGTGTGGPGYQIKAEFNKTPHDPGVLSMARTTDPDSAGSQFFICLDKQSFLDGQYTAFGRTADEESLATVRAIGNAPTGPGDKPRDKVVIEKVTVTQTPKAT